MSVCVIRYSGAEILAQIDLDDTVRLDAERAQRKKFGLK
jgi:hypothetical protein